MPTVPLPDEPNLHQLRNQAKELQRAVRAGDPGALAEVAERHPDPPLDPARTASFQLSTAQLVLARRYGFANWTRLKRHVEVVERHSRFPARMTAGEPADLADRFLRLACLSYDDVGPSQWAEARALLADHPEIREGNAYVAAAAGDAATLRAVLAVDPGAASRDGGPYRWPPLLYLAYARYDPGTEGAVLGVARLLLDAGADPNAGYLWHGFPSPFTVLTGVFGEGELGPVRQPRHAHSLALGRLLLEAGADPNDAQTLYNRMFEPDDDHLELLFEFGLGTGDGGPWRRRLGGAIEPPAKLARGQLAWAITHGMTERVRLLADHGVDLVAPSDEALARAAAKWAGVDNDSATPAAIAATTGYPDLVEYLVGRGAPRPTLDPGGEFVAAVLTADRATVERLRLEHPGLVDGVRADRPGLMAWAAATGRTSAGRTSAVELLVELGFDVNAKGRTDVPSNQPWQTALHRAAEEGDLDLARALLRLGADPDVKDMRFDETPLGWAHHFGHERLIELLEPVTSVTPTG